MITENSRRKQGSWWLLKLDHLWLLLGLLVVGGFISLVPTRPYDFWWHIRAGELIHTNGILRTNTFAWGVPTDTPYVYAMWLAEWLFFQVSQFGGLAALVLLRNILGLFAFVMVAIDAQRRSGSWRLAALAVVLAGAMSMNNLTTRPQNWAWLPFGIFMVVLGQYVSGRWSPKVLWALPVVMLFWVNAHGSFVLGLVMLGIYAVGEAIRLWRGDIGALSQDAVIRLFVCGAVCGVAILCNPIGVNIISYVFMMISHSVNVAVIGDWQPPTTQSLAGKFFFISVILLLLVFGLSRRRPTITDVLLVGAFLWQAFSGQRYVMWFGLLAMPILVQCLANKPKQEVRSSFHRGNILNSIAALVLVGLFALVQPSVKPYLPLPTAYQELFADIPGAQGLFSANTPVKAVDYLRKNPGGRLFNEMGYGSYIAWGLYPTMQAFIDPRVELYPDGIWADYIAISQARDYHELLVERYAVDRVLLDRQLQPQLAQALAEDVRWEREYIDEYAEIYRLR
jgi:hypothetical protein